MYKPENLKKWESGSDYAGEDLTEWYCLVSRTRDSDNLENSNFETILKELGENPSALEEKRGLLVANFRHWACGWFETLMIHESDDELLQRADEIKEKLNDYPVYDEDDYSEREFKSMDENITQAIRDYENDNNLDLTDEQKELIHCEINQNSNDYGADYWPKDQEIESAFH
jgi:hypothetical protein